MSVRQTVTFTEPQMRWLHKRSKELGVTVSDLIRRIIDSRRLETVEVIGNQIGGAPRVVVTRHD